MPSQSLTRAVLVAAIAVSAPSLPLKMNAVSNGVVLAQQNPPSVVPPPPSRSMFLGPAPAPSPVERVGPNQVRIGKILVDTARKELSVAGVINNVNILEFLANMKEGFKAYESAMELETNAVNFNVACLLIGLDPAGAVPARFQFDAEPPKGHPVDVFVEWDDNGRTRRVRAEQFLYDKVTRQTLSEGPWVYTGSVVYNVNRYQAEAEGVLVGFMHTPAPIIENPRTTIGRFGDHIINPDLNIKPGTPVTLVVRALPRPAPAKK